MKNSQSVLHAYYQVGGEAIRETLITVGEAINSRIAGLPFAIKQSVPDYEEVARPSIRSHEVPAFHHQDPNGLKMSLFYIKGSSSKIDFVRTQLAQHRHRRSSKFPPDRNAVNHDVIPWGTEGIIDFLNSKYQNDRLEFNGLTYEYNGRDATGRPMGDIRLVLDKESETNSWFFEAQNVCARALYAVSSRVNVETADTAHIGRIDIQNTNERQIRTVVEDAALELEKSPAIAVIGKLVLKHKIL
jgi:hypothetical protein